MNTEISPTQNTRVVKNPQPPRKPRRHIPNLVNWVVGVLVLFVLVAMALPFNCRVSVKGVQTKSLAQAKQIGLALKIFASDHDGNYPRAGLADMLGADPRDSNAAFSVLFPQYLTNESIFANKLSAYQTRVPDNKYDPVYTGKPARTLEPGENVYGYIAGLNDNNSEPTLPLVADGTDGTGHYTTDPKKRGGVWEGKRAVVIHLDNSGTLETLAGPDHARYIPKRPGATEKEQGNQLDVAGVGPGVRLLDPAVGAR